MTFDKLFGPMGRPPRVILEVVVGSTLHGTAVDDGLEDLDLMAIMLEPVHHVVGFQEKDVEVQRTKPQGVRSEAGDTDRVVYGLRKYLSLALKGNPTILLALFAPEEFCRVLTAEGRALREMRGAIVSQRCYNPFRGYMKQQHERLIGLRGQKSVTRPELVDKFGYDTKYAAHVVRLGYQGEEILRTGGLTLPMPDMQRRRVLAIREGRHKLTEISEMIQHAERRLAKALESSPLPEEPQTALVEKWMIRTYMEAWK